jgi:acetyltransferase-like isoleucine patch superfamily enzyme
MALVLADRVKETTTVTGTGAATLLGAVTGYQSFAAIGNTNTTFYTIAGQTGSEWEVGIGTYSTTGPTLTRTTVLSSSNAGSVVTFSAGTKDVFCTYPSSKSVIGSQGYVENDITITANQTITTGKNAMSAGPITISASITVTIPTGSRWTVV